MSLQSAQLSQLRLPGLPLTGFARSRPLKVLDGGRRARLPTTAARRRRLGCCSAAAGSARRSSEQEPGLPPPAPRPPSWLARAVGQAALLLPAAAFSLGLFGTRSTAWAKPPVDQGPAPVAARSAASSDNLIDESTGAAQPWLYSRGVWNQKQYGTIHKYYTDRKASATAGAQGVAADGAPAAPPIPHPSVPITTAAGAARHPARSLAAGDASGSAASGAGLGGLTASGAINRMNQMGARVADALSGTNLADPQVQRSAAVLVVTVAVLLMFANRGQQQGQRSGGGNGGSMAESSSDSDDGSGAVDGGGASAGAAAAAASLLSLSQEERQAEAARRIAAAKQRLLEAQQKQEKAAAAVEAAAAVQQGAQQSESVADSAVIASMEAIADGGSVGKFTTDAAAALAIAEEAEARAESAAAAATAEVAEAAAAVAAVKEAERQEAAAAGEEQRRQEEAAAAAAERRRQEVQAAAEEERLRREKAAVLQRAEALVEQQREAARKLEVAAAEERRQQEAAAAARQPPPPAPIVGSSFGLDVAGPEGPAAAQPSAGPTPAAARPADGPTVAPAEPAAASSPQQAAPGGVSLLGALGILFKGLNGGSKARAAPRRASAGPGQQLTVGSVGGAGRQLEAASSRGVGAAGSGRAAGAPRDRATAGGEASSGRGIDWGTVLLAPAAPLLASLPSRGEGDGAAAGNKYDMLLNVLSAAAAAPEAQGDSRYDPVRSLLKAAPATGVPRYDFARSLLRGMVADDVRSSNGAFDMAWGLLQRVRSGELVPTGPAAYDPVWWLLHEATVLQEWGGDRYNPLAGLEDWGPPPAGTRAKYCPWSDLVHAAWEGKVASTKADPLRNWLREFSAPTGSSRYCPVSELRALAGSDWRGPSGRSKYDMVAAALDAAAGWEAPQGRSPYDPMTEILAYEPPAAGSSPLAWLLNGWAAGWRQGGREGGKYAPNLLAAIKGAAPSAQRSKFDPISGEWRSTEHELEVQAAVQSAAAADRLANGGSSAWDGSGAEGAPPRVRSGSADWS